MLLIAVIVALALLALAVSWGSATGPDGARAIETRSRPTGEPAPPHGRPA